MKYEALTVIRSSVRAAGRRAYHIKKYGRNTDKVAEAAAEEVSELFGPKTIRAAEREALLDWIRRQITSKFQQQEDREQINWLKDLEVQRPIRVRGVLVAIGDMTLDDVEEVRKQMDGNIGAAQAEKENFEAAAQIIEPIMKARGCTWGEAAATLKE